MAYQANKAAKTASKARGNAGSNAGLIEVHIEYRAVGDLVLDPRNPRQHSLSQIDQIADSIREFIGVLTRRKLVVLLAVILTPLGAFAYSIAQSKLYEGSASVLVTTGGAAW